MALRKKQYAFYRDKLLSFDESVERVKLGEICEILRGSRLTRSQLCDDGKYPVLHGGLVPLGYYNECNRKAGTTIVVNTGSAGSVYYSDKEFWSSDACFSLYPCDKLLDRYVYHFLAQNEYVLKSKIRVGAMPTIDSAAVSTLLIPLPPLSEQQRIVAILDRFDTLCNDLTSGIPAEIEARKKQYAYYRNLLLRFEKAA